MIYIIFIPAIIGVLKYSLYFTVTTIRTRIVFCLFGKNVIFKQSSISFKKHTSANFTNYLQLTNRSITFRTLYIYI